MPVICQTPPYTEEYGWAGPTSYGIGWMTYDGNITRTIGWLEKLHTPVQVTGDIRIKDNATLILKNVKVEFDESDQQIIMNDNATLLIINSIIYGSIKANNSASITMINSTIKKTITLNQDSSLNASNSKLYHSLYCIVHGYNHTTGGISAYQDSEITLDDCNVGYLWLHDNSTATVDNSFIYYSFPDGGNLHVKDSTIQTHREKIDNLELSLIIPVFEKYSGKLDSFLPSSGSVFDNVTLVDGLWLNTNHSNIKISDSRLYLIFCEGTSEITLNNVTLTRVTGQTLERDIFTLFIDRCNISQIDSMGNNDTVYIDHSRIGSVSLRPYNLDLDISNSRIDDFQMDDVWFKPFQARISHSTIGFFSPGLGNDVANEYYLHNVTLLDGLGFKVGAWGSTGGIDLHGEIQFGDGFSVNETVVDGFAVINRYYPVFVNSTNGPVANVSIVASIGNRTIWTGETNRDGIVEFPVRYVNIFNLVRPYNPSEPSVVIVNNITEVVSLSWSYGDVEGSIDLDLLTTTPIVVEIVTESGYGNLLIFAIVAIIVFSIIFYKRR